MGDGKQGTRWVLGFDGGCGTCSQLAKELVALSGDKLTAKSLRSPEVRGWREKAGGSDGPWVPTLFAVSGEHVQAWTGLALCARLALLLGPGRTWVIARRVGELVSPEVGTATLARRHVVTTAFKGAAVGLALLASGRPLAPLAVVAQDVSEAGTRRVQWRADKLSRAAMNGMSDRAQRDRDFEMIREYFESSGKWARRDREGVQIDRDNRLWRRAFQLRYRNRDSEAKAFVQFSIGASGKQTAMGYIWRGRELGDVVFVQNGNLRSQQRGRIDRGAFAAASESESPADCLAVQLACSMYPKDACEVQGEIAALVCSENEYAAATCAAAAEADCRRSNPNPAPDQGYVDCVNRVDIFCDVSIPFTPLLPVCIPPGGC